MWHSFSATKYLIHVKCKIIVFSRKTMINNSTIYLLNIENLFWHKIYIFLCKILKAASDFFSRTAIYFFSCIFHVSWNWQNVNRMSINSWKINLEPKIFLILIFNKISFFFTKLMICKYFTISRNSNRKPAFELFRHIQKDQQNNFKAM